MPGCSTPSSRKLAAGRSFRCPPPKHALAPTSFSALLTTACLHHLWTCSLIAETVLNLTFPAFVTFVVVCGRQLAAPHRRRECHTRPAVITDNQTCKELNPPESRLESCLTKGGCPFWRPSSTLDIPYSLVLIAPLVLRARSLLSVHDAFSTAITSPGLRRVRRPHHDAPRELPVSRDARTRQANLPRFLPQDDECY